MRSMALRVKPKVTFHPVHLDGVRDLALVLSAAVLAPLIAFAALWSCLIVMIGGAWVLHQLTGF